MFHQCICLGCKLSDPLHSIGSIFQGRTLNKHCCCTTGHGLPYQIRDTLFCEQMTQGKPEMWRLGGQALAWDLWLGCKTNLNNCISCDPGPIFLDTPCHGTRRILYPASEREDEATSMKQLKKYHTFYRNVKVPKGQWSFLVNIVTAPVWWTKCISSIESALWLKRQQKEQQDASKDKNTHDTWIRKQHRRNISNSNKYKIKNKHNWKHKTHKRNKNNMGNKNKKKTTTTTTKQRENQPASQKTNK